MEARRSFCAEALALASSAWAMPIGKRTVASTKQYARAIIICPSENATSHNERVGNS
jgi:hypothetical protein